MSDEVFPDPVHAEYEDRIEELETEVRAQGFVIDRLTKDNDTLRRRFTRAVRALTGLEGTVSASAKFTKGMIMAQTIETLEAVRNAIILSADLPLETPELAALSCIYALLLYKESNNQPDLEIDTTGFFKAFEDNAPALDAWLNKFLGLAEDKGESWQTTP